MKGALSCLTLSIFLLDILKICDVVDCRLVCQMVRWTAPGTSVKQALGASLPHTFIQCSVPHAQCVCVSLSPCATFGFGHLPFNLTLTLSLTHIHSLHLLL